MPEYTFDTILDALAAHRQRATYAAVAAAIGTIPRTLMAGRPRDRRHCWIVNRQTGEPTGYQPDQVDPELTSHTGVLTSREELLGWLRDVQ